MRSRVALKDERERLVGSPMACCFPPGAARSHGKSNASRGVGTPAGPSRAAPHYVTPANSRTAMQEVDDKLCRRGRLLFRDPVPAIRDDRIFDVIGDPPLRALERYFDATVEELLADRLHKGCFVVNTALEVASHDQDFQDVVTEVFAE